MRPISTRQAEKMKDIKQIFALRYDYYIVARELDIASDHVLGEVMLPRDCLAVQFGTYAGDNLIGCFRMEFGPPRDLAFAAAWSFEDFVADLPEMTAIVSGFCISPHLRDDRVIGHMVRESVGIAKEFGLSHMFFETSPDLWPYFHAEGLSRRGEALRDRETGLPTAVYMLAGDARVCFPSAQVTARSGDIDMIDMTAQTSRPRLAIVGGRGR